MQARRKVEQCDYLFRGIFLQSIWKNWADLKYFNQYSKWLLLKRVTQVPHSNEYYQNAGVKREINFLVHM